MKYRIIPLVAASAVTLTSLTAAPAYAGSDSGSQSCGTAAYVSLRGEQQKQTSTMSLYLPSGTRVWRGSGYFVKVYDSRSRSATWSVTSDYILLSGSYAWCKPPA